MIFDIAFFFSHKQHQSIVGWCAGCQPALFLAKNEFTKQ